VEEGWVLNTVISVGVGGAAASLFFLCVQSMDEGTLKTPIPKCRLYWTFCLGGGEAVL
jgi:hypothetical protein